MEEQWLKRIQERLANNEQKAPEGLWDEIERSLNKAALPVNKKQAGKIVFMLRRWRMVSVAAIAIFVIITGFILLFDASLNDNVHENYASTVAKSGGDSAETGIVAEASTEEYDGNGQRNDVPGIVAASMVKRENKAVINKQIEEEAGRAVAENGAVLQDSVVVNHYADNRTNKEDNHKPFVFGTGEPDYEKMQRNTYYVHDVANRIKDNGKWNVGLYASNSINGNNTVSTGYRNFKIGANPFAIIPGKTDWTHNAMANIMLNNLNTLTMTDIKHHLPVRVGASVNYALTDRWGLESGLAYTVLVSDLHSGSADDYYETEQKLHYIGIPLKVNFKIWGNEHFSVYAAAGGMMEIPVAGQSKTNYINNGNVVDNDRESVNPKRLQWSVGADVGAQYNISSVVGVYVEPGVGYYFDDGSNVLTIYKEKKFAFDFQLGVRFNFNN